MFYFRKDMRFKVNFFAKFLNRFKGSVFNICPNIILPKINALSIQYNYKYKVYFNISNIIVSVTYSFDTD